MNQESLEQKIEPGATSSKPSVKEKSDSKSAAKKRAKEILKSGTVAGTIQPGAVINGNADDWHYYQVPNSGDKARLIEKITRLGYEPAPDTKLAGVYGGQVWRVPMEIRKKHLETRKQNLERKK